MIHFIYTKKIRPYRKRKYIIEIYFLNVYLHCSSKHNMPALTTSFFKAIACICFKWFIKAWRPVVLRKFFERNVTEINERKRCIKFNLLKIANFWKIVWKWKFLKENFRTIVVYFFSSNAYWNLLIVPSGEKLHNILSIFF